MSDPARQASRIDGIDLMVLGLFAGVVVLAAWTVLEWGTDAAAGGLLLAGLTGFVALGFLVSRRARRSSPVSGADDGEFISALEEPSAMVAVDGRIRSANAAWLELVGRAHRLPRTSASAPGLFEALTEARRGRIGRARLAVGGLERPIVISAVGSRRFLVRLLQASPSTPAPEMDTRPARSPPQPSSGPTPDALDAFAAAAPFGAALLGGGDPFLAPILEANPTLSAITSVQGVGSAFGDLFDAASLNEARQRLEGGRSNLEAVEMRLANDPARIVHLYLSPSGERWVAFLVDVSEQKQIELQLAQSQKMQAIGQLAGGVAHDFNNLLMAIFMQLDELAQRHPVGDPSYEGLNQIRQTSTRAAELVRKLLAFSRKQTVQRESLDLGELISEFEVLLRRVLPEDIALVTEYGRNLPVVRADRGQLETAVMNLVVNARDAIRSHGGSTVKIRAARVSAAEAQALGYPDPQGEQAMIEVSDDGSGIPADVLDKIFDPFFTTKPVGEGTGLGLATVYGIVKQSDGWIWVESRPGQGAAFRIFLPVHVPVMTPFAPARPTRPAARDLSGAGRILFVEDEDAVRSVAAKLLRARGYEVIEAASGEEALDLAEVHAGEIDLMISDVVMPGMQGPELLRAARHYLAGAPVMFISGYAEAEFSNLLEGEANVSFLAKPIDIKTLAERVKQELQRAE
ncbi:MAG: response regulator [Phenylobacterium sp.]|uniref:ATP-binding protein n=1 Tax=Phenylobacterium sp. TaxID=1871053 RepID=UPI0025EF6CFC|nr:ATP-binding protein [Phenylobacterium sp.]MCA3714984.1 response regulator [Phenylobacterium sp.]MCA3737256.1 response regulator [Phenylobacterium sp.]MCA4917612.1 response regulator [Phenylobacterium sp.]